MKTLNVKVVNFGMPFFAIVGFMIKVAIAAIPAMIGLIFIGMVAGSFLSGIIKP